ncbi:hypothetical protein [Sphingobium sp. RSMS]|uniref:hypothetical protein n=1 Tax=Sphingobium sp. RSMS TaxID=520734 RepID=UPI0021D3726E|nr:hypothetical protein [Sphingobium sp. RSMS]
MPVRDLVKSLSGLFRNTQPNFEYAPATPEILAKVAAIKAIADRYSISMKAAGLQPIRRWQPSSLEPAARSASLRTQQR